MKKLFILLVILMPYAAKSQSFQRVSAAESLSLIEGLHDEKEVIVDCRSDEMYREKHIHRAINIDAFHGSADTALLPLLEKERIVLYCTNINRSEIIAEKLKTLEYKGEIIIVDDGINGWINNGFALETVSAMTVQDMPVNKNAGEQKGKPIIQVFGNFDFNASKGAEKKYGFWFGRAHFGYEYQFSREFSGKIVLDIGRPTTLGQIIVNDSSGNPINVSSTGKDGSYYTMTLKFASLEWKPLDFLKIQAGGILQNHYITQEKFWGYRYLAETFQDRYFRIPSGDLGAIAYVKVSEKLGFDVALTNGEGFRFDQDAFGDVKLAAGLDYIPVNGLQTRIYWDHTSSANPATPAVQQMVSAFAGYRFKEKFRLAAEYNYRINHLNINELDLYGYSLSGSYRVFRLMEVFARFDHLMDHNPDGTAESYSYHSAGKALITGVHYNPVKGINVSLNYQSWFPETKETAQNHHILLSFEYKL
jgi:rhodanese-related sulfurtransferase